MRSLLLVTVCALASACMEAKVEVAPTKTIEVETAVNSDCYTVDLFTDVKVQQPAKSVPKEHRAFLGNWGAGAWNDVWCHDLLVTKVEHGGKVELIEMHAPYEPWHQPATAFARVGHIDKEGNLRFAYGTERISYRIENGKLIGSRSGRLGDLRVELRRRGVPPIPTPNPMCLAQLGSSAQQGG